MDRSDYVLLWTNKVTTNNNSNMFCSVCRVDYRGSRCPPVSFCGYPSETRFNNTKHIIIATTQYCNAKKQSCNNDCTECTITNTYPSVKVIIP